MPKAARQRAPPGFDAIRPALEEYRLRLRALEDAPVALLVKKNEALWEVFQVHHQQLRYVYELRFKKRLIDKTLYAWLVKNRYADGALIARWRKQGYEKLCCLQCIATSDTNHSTTCICRVPPKDADKEVQCITCGCRGCSTN